MKTISLLLSLLLVAIATPILFGAFARVEGFELPGVYPFPPSNLLLNQLFPINKRGADNHTSAYSASDIWKDYPRTPVGSFEPVTNNIRYPVNPDIGICTPAEMCGALYLDRNIPSSPSSKFTPPPMEGQPHQVRVGSFVANGRIITSLPFM